MESNEYVTYVVEENENLNKHKMEQTLFLTPEDKNIVIIGYAATGKSFFADMLMSLGINKYDYKLIRSDDYQNKGFQQSLYVMMSHIQHMRLNGQERFIVEGIQGYRLLRKGLEEQTFFADVVFLMKADKATRHKRYLNRKDSIQKMGYLDGFDSMLNKVWLDYLNMVLQQQKTLKKIPRLVEVNTTNNATTFNDYRSEV